MKYIIKNITYIVIFIVFLVSCTEESKFNNPVDFGLSNGAFARFIINPSPTVSFADPSIATFSATIEDLNNNISKYSLSLTANVNGSQFTSDNILEITSFPAELNISAQLIADKLNLTVDDLNFGDNFVFIAEVERNDGVIFNGVLASLDEDNNISNGGTLSDPLLTSAGYRNAMNFDFTFACPTFSIEDVVGEYDVLNFSFAGTFPLTTPTREIIAGPDDNQITIVGGEYIDYGADDLILNVDVNTGVATLAEEGLIAFDEAAGAFDTDNVGSVEGLVLPCANNVINLIVDFEAFAGNSHPFNLRKR